MISRIAANNRRIISPLSGRARRGTTMVEAAISLGFICTLIIGCIDFSIAAFRAEALNHLAHRVGRAAIIHGTYAPTGISGGAWGPAGVTTTLSGTDSIATLAKTYGAGMNASAVSLHVTWPNGDNKPGSPVLVETSIAWSPMFLESMGYGVLTLRGKSYQIIQH